MFTRFSGQALRRALHTSSTRTRASSVFPRAAVAASLATAYFTWQLSTPVALDAPSPTLADRQTASSEHSLSSKLDQVPSSPAPPSLVPSPEAPSEPQQPDAPTPEAELPSGEESPQDGSSGGAYNPVTGEINWDCPCLGGMAHGPCGQQFRDAFSCFVYSEAEPKGMDCVEKFQAMQNCFREHPDVYGEDAMNEDEDDMPGGDVSPPSNPESTPTSQEAPSPEQAS